MSGKNTRVKMSNLQIPRLPDDLFHGILSRLSVKTIMRFRSVCKSWDLLTRSNHFVKMHLERAVADSDSQRVLLSLAESVAVHEEEDEQIGTTSFALDMDSFKEVHISLSCNGLFCMTCCLRTARVARLFLWNPSTREFKELSGKCSIDCYMMTVHGFGYDASGDDYKIVRAHWDLKEESKNLYPEGRSYVDHGRNIAVEVLSCKTNSWRRVKDHHSRSYFRKPKEAVYFNGGLHWHGRRVGHRGSVIVSFNLTTESFEELVMEEESEPSYAEAYLVSLSYVGGISCICALVESEEYEFIAILRLNQNGGKAYWTSLVYIPYDIDNNPPVSIFLPICFTKNGEIFLNSDGLDVVMYNPEDETYRYRFTDHEGVKHMRPYVESLVSPNDVVGEANN